MVLGTAHTYKFFETVKKATGEIINPPPQLEKFVDKDEKFDIVENNNSKIKNYILSKLQWKLEKAKKYHLLNFFI